MENRIKISDFVKLTGSTLKTVKYYHKIGLLSEPERSSGGYRLYGPAELARMLSIKRLKSLGLDLQRVKTILGESGDPRTLREVLRSLQIELLSEKQNLEERLARIEKLLAEGEVRLGEDTSGSPSFKMIAEILGPDQMERYTQACPELSDQHQKLYGILDDFQWGEDYRDTFRALAEYFKARPEQYQMALDSGARLARLAQLSEDDPEVEALARESVELIKSMPLLEEMLCSQSGPKKPLAGLYDELVAGVLSPAQMRYKQLFEKYLYQGAGKQTSKKPPEPSYQD
ncbi:MAG: MerR family transcriptional regulator [Firmicutes bacterium]|nr:MerR family transcriptional regulator [Bacillota bacterium]